MKKFATSLIATLTIFTGFTFQSMATDVDHFKGQASPDLKSALCNLQQFDQKLAKVTNGKALTGTEMAEIHQLTYTLEVAVQKVQAEMAIAAEELEKVHKGSEVMASEKVKKSTEDYLTRTQLLTSPLKCS